MYCDWMLFEFLYVTRDIDTSPRVEREGGASLTGWWEISGDRVALLCSKGNKRKHIKIVKHIKIAVFAMLLRRLLY